MPKNQKNNLDDSRRKNIIANILVVDSDVQSARLILELAARKGIHVNLANGIESALDLFEKDKHELVFLSDKVEQTQNDVPKLKSSFELLHKIRSVSPELPIIMFSSAQLSNTQSRYVAVETAVKAIHAGCSDFLIKPLDKQKVENILDTFVPNHKVFVIASAEEGDENLYTIVGKSAKLVQTVELAKKIAPTSVSVLISGESGTGKELISYLVHQNSKRSQGPYIKVNCAALNDSLLESELFGHEKGAFTGAYSKRKGRFEMANGGTLLLDEISETPLKFQSKLLRIIEQQDFERVGGNENIRIDVRIISTTNKNLLEEVQKGTFRLDLYYRLSGARLILAPLRERIEDLSEIVWHFVNLYAKQASRRITKLDSSMMDLFSNYHWPGNVRQLRNVVLTSLMLGSGETLSLADVSWLFDELQPLPQEQKTNINTLSENFERLNEQNPNLGGVSLEKLERQAILDTLRQTQGNQRKAAEVLGISDRTLRGKIKRYRQQGSLQTIGK
ncbi:MAG: sigma-54-dependent transcriptional regulator [Planctomycetota bacterium]